MVTNAPVAGTAASAPDGEPAGPRPGRGDAVGPPVRPGLDTDSIEPRPGVLAEVAGELRWAFAERHGWLIGIALKLVVAVVYVGYTHYRPHSHDTFRIAGVATAAALWVLADVVNTNQLGADPERTADRLEQGHGVAHELALKNGALALVLLPLTVVISVAVRVALDRWRAIPHAVVLDLAVVFLWMGIGNVISVLLPYRPIALRERWRRRRSWPRWMICLAAPYVALLLVRWIAWPADRLAHHRVLGAPDTHLMAYALLYLAWSVAVWGTGLAFAGTYSRVAEARLDRALHRSD